MIGKYGHYLKGAICVCACGVLWFAFGGIDMRPPPGGDADFNGNTTSAFLERPGFGRLQFGDPKPLAPENVRGDAGMSCLNAKRLRDPDVKRNRDLLENAPICITTESVEEGGVEWRFQVFDSGKEGWNWVVLHDDEDSAFDAAIHAIISYGGKAIAIDSGEREAPTHAPNPNSNFGMTADEMKGCGSRVETGSPKFTSWIIGHLRSERTIALHNNEDGIASTGGLGNFSVSAASSGIMALPSFSNIGRLSDPDNAVLLPSLVPPAIHGRHWRSFVDFLRSVGVNVIVERIDIVDNDCSFSRYMTNIHGNKNLEYINIETQKGDLESQIQIINHVIGLLSK